MSMTDPCVVPATPPPAAPRLAIQDVSAWVLRIGVVSSVVVMLLGLALRFYQGIPTTQHMQSVPYDASLDRLIHGVLSGEGRSIIEVGILLLVLTPILRVATSMILFLVEEHDWFYTLVTLTVLSLTLLSLLVLR